jgi:hypothetical protein
MTNVRLVGVLVTALAAAVPASGQAPATAGTSLGSITLGRAVMANGERLAAGTYQVRLTADEPKPGVGQTPSAERYVEFVRGGKVVGREVATVIPASEIGQVAEGGKARTGTRVEMLKGDDYVRVWNNRAGTNYLIHLPPAK